MNFHSFTKIKALDKFVRKTGITDIFPRHLFAKTARKKETEELSSAS